MSETKSSQSQVDPVGDAAQGSAKPRRASVRDVARRANVSPSTVSRVLRGSTLATAPTRDRVLRAASELAYSLPPARGRPTLVGVLARFPVQWFFAEVIVGIEQALAESDVQLVLHNVGDPRSRRLFFERIVPRGQFDALVIVSSSFDELERTALDRLSVPITVVGGFAPGLSRAGIDEKAAARSATRHLIGLGHREIGLISFAPSDQVGLDTTRGRQLGFESALIESGLQIVPGWTVASNDSRMSGGVRAAEMLLTLPSLPSALLAMSDELAIGALRTLRRAGIRVPEQMSIVGIDDHEMSEFTDLTTISQPVRAQGQTAAKMLLDLLSGRTTDLVDIDLPVRLVVRGTTGPVQRGIEGAAGPLP